MGLKCKIRYKSGEAFAYDSNGEISSLYLDALAVTNNQGRALNMWATAQTPKFKQLFGDFSPQIEDVVKYYETVKSDGSTLSSADIFQITQFIKSNGLTSLSQLQTVLNSIFKEDGNLGINVVNAINSGIYSADELKDINLGEISNILSKIEGHLVKEDIFVEPDDQEFFYKNSEFKTIFGSYEKVPSSEVDTEIAQVLNNFTDDAQIYDAIQKLPYSDFVERFTEDEAFARDTINRIKGLNKIPLLTYIASQLTDKPVEFYSTLKNTLLDGPVPLKLEATFDYLSKIDIDVWQNNLEDIREVLKEAELTAIESNIDIIGLNQSVPNYQGVMSVMSSMIELLRNKTEENLVLFSAIHAEVIGNEVPSVFVEKINPTYSGLNIVKVFSSKNEDQLFESDGLIKIGDNLYHKVEIPANKTAMYENLYRRLREGNLGIPLSLSREIDYSDPLNKTQILEIISEYVMTRDVGFETRNQEDISLNQLVFNHLPIEEPNFVRDASLIIDTKTDPQYLKTRFVSDFYNYILSEKYDNSEVYRTTLSKFKINDRDISLIGEVDNIDFIEYSEELKDYIRLKKDQNMKHLVEEPNYPVLEDLLFLNFPDQVPETKAYFVLDGDYAVMGKSADLFVKIQKDTYRKVADTDEISVYNKIVSTPDQLYYDNNLNFSFDKEAVKQVVQNYRNFSGRSYDFEQYKSRLELSDIGNKLDIDTQPYYLQNFGEEGFLEDLRLISEKPETVFSSIRPSKNITIDANKISTRYTPGSKIDTPGKAFAVNERFYKQVKQKLQGMLGPYFNERFVKKTSNAYSYSVEVNIPEEFVRTLEEQELVRELSENDISRNMLSIVDDEIARGVDSGVLEEIGYNISELETEEPELSSDLKDVSLVFNSNLELLNLYSPQQSQTILNRLDECG